VTLLSAAPQIGEVLQAPNLVTARKLLESNRIDAIVCDLTLPDGNGIEFASELRTKGAKVKLLMLSMHDERVFAERALRAGASGYLMKDEADTSLIGAIERVLGGEIALSSAMHIALLQRIRTESSHTSGLAALSDRELGILTLMGHGKSSKEIAFELSLSLRTVEAHRANIKRKLELRTGAEVAAFAISFVRPTMSREPPHLRKKTLLAS
jgi:DNA-binding NarL/FixJ family response regulator